MNTKQMTFRELIVRFPDEASCKTFLKQKRWPDGVIKCPRCGEKAYTLKARPFHYLCKSGKQSAMPETGEVVTCHKKNGYRFSVITRTVFENTNYPLREWFRVIFFMFHAKKGMSAHQIHQMIGTGSYETAWYMCTRIRAAMKDEELPKRMGEVEADETFIGGKDKNRHYWIKGPDGTWQHGRGGKRGPIDKLEVIGAIARKGNVVCKMIGRAGEAGFDTHEKFVRNVIADNVSLVATDEANHYRHLGKDLPHEKVTHRDYEYVRGLVHTQTIESFWSLLKRGIHRQLSQGIGEVSPAVPERVFFSIQ
jgi:hypothetical protein